MTFVDTNYFLRFLLQDDDKLFQEAKQLFLEGARGDKELITSTIVFFEIYWVLKSYYEKSKTDVIPLLRKLLTLSFIELEERETLYYTLIFFEKTNYDMEDCYNLAFAKEKNLKEFKTFDRPFAKYFQEKLE